MKKWLFTLLALPFMFTSCIDDESNEELRTLNPIQIENIRIPDSFSIFMGDTLKIQPLIYCEGVPDAKLSFEWRLSGGTIAPRVIDSTMYCEAKLVIPPFANPYTLRLTVTDETTGISRIETFNVRVLSSFGEGLIVADTKDDKESDLTLVMSKQFSSEISGNDDKMKIVRNLWSESNGQKLDGKVLDLITSSYGTNRSMTVVTDKHLYRADYYDYFNIPEEFDGGMFIVVPPHVGHGYKNAFFQYYNSTGEEFLSLDGLVTRRSMQQNNRKHSYTQYPRGVTDYNVTFMCSPKYNDVYAFDALGERIIFFNFQNASLPQNQSSTGEFDIRDLKDFEALYMGEINQGVALLTKQKSTGQYKALVMQRRGLWDPQPPTYAKAVFDFSDATEIESAKFFELNKREDVVYYATDTKLYATPLSVIDAKVQWEADTSTGEKITGLKLYKWSGGTCDYEEVGAEEDEDSKKSVSSSDRLMMITTYSELTKEGRVYCVPIVTYGLGGLEQNKNYHVVLNGFNKILGVYKQNN